MSLSSHRQTGKRTPVVPPLSSSKFGGLAPRWWNIVIVGAFVLLALAGGLIAYLMSVAPLSAASRGAAPPPSNVAATPAVRRPLPGKPNATPSNPGAPVAFSAGVGDAMGRRGMNLANACPPDDPVARRILEDYGAMFVAAESVTPPPVCVFESEPDVLRFQIAVGYETVNFGGIRLQLQPAAMRALLAARQEAQQQGLDISPRGADAARRSYEDTVSLWHSRVYPALNYWAANKRLTKEQSDRVRNMPVRQQVEEVLELEKKGIWFSKDLSKSILYSIAAPGSSQHISMLALDVAQFGDERVRQILRRHGWFQTVKSDLPHFTYLGVDENVLPSLGLRSVVISGQMFWIPNI